MKWMNLITCSSGKQRESSVVLTIVLFLFYDSRYYNLKFVEKDAEVVTFKKEEFFCLKMEKEYSAKSTKRRRKSSRSAKSEAARRFTVS